MTVLFSDLSGYTSMSEKLDPEEVKEITSGIFRDIARVIVRYEGFIEKYIGDAILAVFGVPQAHEDDPLRAIRAARDIHDLVGRISPQIEARIDRPLTMHTGINTGLVVTGEVNVDQGTHGLAGDAINTAARLQGLAKAGEILVGQETYLQSQGHFEFEQLEPTAVKGKKEPVTVYRMLEPKGRPVTIRRLSGRRADLIGRGAEMSRLQEAYDNLQQGTGAIASIVGDAGTGKSRLLREFQESLDPAGQWFEGHAYAYARNISYFPLIDMFSRIFGIEESDPADRVKAKLESGITELVGDDPDIIPSIGSLYALSYQELEAVQPELWKSRLKNAVKTVLSALSRRGPTIFCLEDLHWADPSSVDILRYLLLEFKAPALVLCLYRPHFSLFTSHQLAQIGSAYQELQLQDLSSSDAQSMLESLLATEQIPSELGRFVREKAEGNPFYLEELVNFLLDSNRLVQEEGTWHVRQAIQDAEVSSNIHSMIASRLDRLEARNKRILQEASVVGRSFLYDILQKVSVYQDHCDTCLGLLERLDLIKTRSFEPELEYIFKHALTQEVVYNGLLKKERQDIHERIAAVIEEIFQDRLPEFYETLAFHYRRGQSVIKSAEYLLHSGKKCLARHALDEAHENFQEAYEVLDPKPDKSDQEKATLIDVINDWGYVHYYRGDINTWLELLTSQNS